MRDTDEDADVLKARRGRSEVVTEQIRDKERDGGMGGGMENVGTVTSSTCGQSQAVDVYGRQTLEMKGLYLKSFFLQQ